MEGASTTIETRCECQAVLGAKLDEQRLIVEGWGLRAGRETAPALSFGRGDKLDVGWQCPFCGRNVLRTFDSGGL